MRALVAGFALAAIALLAISGDNFAQDKKDEKKEVVLKGKITCAKCDLNVEKKCATVIVVKDDKSKKDVTYYFDKDGHGKFHDDICSAPVAAPVRPYPFVLQVVALRAPASKRSGYVRRREPPIDRRRGIPRYRIGNIPRRHFAHVNV